jgi:hypothetical protein
MVGPNRSSLPARMANGGIEFRLAWTMLARCAIDFIATLPTASLHLQWLLWSRQIEKSYDSCLERSPEIGRQLSSVSRRWLPLPLLALTAIKQSFGASTGPGRSGSYTRYSWRYADSGVRPGGLAALATASLPSELAVRFLGRQRRARGEASTNRTHCP